MRKMYTSLRRPLFKPKETEFFIDVITNTMKHRASSKLRFVTTISVYDLQMTEMHHCFLGGMTSLI